MGTGRAKAIYRLEEKREEKKGGEVYSSLCRFADVKFTVAPGIEFNSVSFNLVSRVTYTRVQTNTNIRRCESHVEQPMFRGILSRIIGRYLTKVYKISKVK